VLGIGHEHDTPIDRGSEAASQPVAAKPTGSRS
jgi:hypothetical protein